MERKGYIEIKVDGSKGNFPLTPDNYDIRDIVSILEQAENLLFPDSKKDRPVISYNLQEGSVKHIIKTSLQVIIGFNAILASIQQNNNSIDFLEIPTAKAFEFFQETAKKQDIIFEISTSVDHSCKISVNRNTEFMRTEDFWANAEFYFYGDVIDAGGKTHPNIHLDTKEYGVLKIEVDRDLLREYESNPLYKSYGVRAIGKQNVRTGEIDRASLKLLEMIDSSPSYQEDYIKSLINKARKNWEGISDADEWLSQFR